MYEQNKQGVNEQKFHLYEEAKAEGKEPRNTFNYFQLAITQMWNQTSREEQVKYRNLAKSWNEEGVPKDQKQE